MRIYQAKTWIDMFGQRLFEVLGSLAIIVFTQKTVFPATIYPLSGLIPRLCMLWIAGVFALGRDYREGRWVL